MKTMDKHVPLGDEIKAVKLTLQWLAKISLA